MKLKNHALDLIKERMEKLEQKEDMELNDDFRYGFTIGFLDAFDFAEEVEGRED